RGLAASAPSSPGCQRASQARAPRWRPGTRWRRTAPGWCPGCGRPRGLGSAGG
ncbi:unnamed protein product, partial [Prorocentrum cordatum]